MPSVLQPWLEQIPIRMQSTLLLSLRGPDTHRCPEVKKVQRWMRGLAFVPGNPYNVKEFMTSIDDVPKLEEKGPLARELEFCTQHFYAHLLHGLQVIGEKHPNHRIRLVAHGLYVSMSALFHLETEDSEDFNQRLGHIDWPNGVQPTDFDQAVKLLELLG